MPRRRVFRSVLDVVRERAARAAVMRVPVEQKAPVETPAVEPVERTRSLLTEQFVATVKPPEKSPDKRVVQKDHWDRKTPGLSLRVSSDGRKTFSLVYRHQGQQRRISLGTADITTVAAAKERAREILALVQGGVDPAAVRQSTRDADTFETLAERYLTEYAATHCRGTTINGYQVNLKNHLLPAWGKRKAVGITRRDVLDLVDRIAHVDKHPIQANRVHSLIGSILKFGVSKEVVEVNVARDVPRPGKEHPGQRYLNDEELTAVLRSLPTAATSEAVADAIRLIIYTGSRHAEATTLKWSELNLERAIWEQTPVEGRKSKRAFVVPLVGEVLAILRRRKEGSSSESVFPSPLKPSIPVSNTNITLKRIFGATPFRWMVLGLGV